MSTGIFNTGLFAPSLQKPSFAQMITRLMPNGTASLFALTGMLASDTALQFEHGFFTKTMLFPQMTVSAAGQTATDTVFTVASTANILPNMVVRVDSTGEHVLVNSVLSNTSVSVQRGFGTVAAAAIAASVNLYQVGTAFEEGSLRPQSLLINPVKITNYTQIFRNTWAITDSARATQVIAGETPMAESRQDCAAFHATDIERSIFFGQRTIGQRNGQPIHTMGGLIETVGNLANYPTYYSAPNVFTAGGTTNYTQLEGFLDPCFNQATDPKVGNQRILFCGGQARKVINNIGRLNATYYLQDGQTSWGLQFATFKTARGTFTVIEHPLFTGNQSWTKMAIAVDVTSFRLAYLAGRKTQNKEFNMDGAEANDNGIDAVGGTLTTEVTAVVKNPPANSVVYNLTAAAAG